MKSYGRLTLALIAAWFLTAVSASMLHVFQNSLNRIGVAVAMAAVLPIAVFLLWFATSTTFRQFALSLNPRTLTLLHSWRIFGFAFVLLAAYGVLPAQFAFPAGYGDMTIGVTATVVAWKLATPHGRNGFILWQALGILDLLMAVGLGATVSLFNPHGIAMTAMTVLPLSLVPTFFVPLLFIFHIICIAQARQWNPARPTASGALSLA